MPLAYSSFEKKKCLLFSHILSPEVKSDVGESGLVVLARVLSFLAV